LDAQVYLVPTASPAISWPSTAKWVRACG